MMNRKFALAMSAVGVLMCLGVLGFQSAGAAEFTIPQDAADASSATDSDAEKSEPANAAGEDAAKQKKLIQPIFAKTRTALSAKDYSEIIDDCQSALKLDLTPANQQYLRSLVAWAFNRRGEVRYDVAEKLRDAGNTEQSVAAAEKAQSDYQSSLEYDPQRWRAALNLGRLQMRSSRWDEAKASLSRAIDVHPESGAAWFNRAEVCYQQGEFEAAIDDYQKCLEQNASDLQAITGRAHCYFQLGQIDHALREYEIVVKFQPESAQAIANRGDAYHAQGQWERAFNDFNQALEIESLPSVYQQMSWMVATCPDAEYFRPQLSLDLIKKAIEMEGETRSNLDTLAAAQAANGDFDSARQSQQKAIELAKAAAGATNPEMANRLALYQKNEPFQQDDSTLRR